MLFLHSILPAPEGSLVKDCDGRTLRPKASTVSEKTEFRALPTWVGPEGKPTKGGCMVYKHLAVLAAVLILGGMLATPAVAHQLTVANASINCGGGCLNLTATDLTPGDMDKITFTFVLTPVSGVRR